MVVVGGSVDGRMTSAVGLAAGEGTFAILKDGVVGWGLIWGARVEGIVLFGTRTCCRGDLRGEGSGRIYGQDALLMTV